jgi:hypothetical protein
VCYAVVLIAPLGIWPAASPSSKDSIMGKGNNSQQNDKKKKKPKQTAAKKPEAKSGRK